MAGVRGTLINTKNNAELLKHVPHRSFLDLSVVYRFYEGEMLLLVDNSIMEYKHLEEEKLFEIAMHDPNSIPVIYDIIEGFKIHGPKELMYLMSNQDANFGAFSVIRGKSALRDFSEKIGKDIVLLPSSIHEWILLPADSPANPEELSCIIQQVNQELVPDGEVLSDHPYIYWRDTDEITFFE